MFEWDWLNHYILLSILLFWDFLKFAFALILPALNSFNTNKLLYYFLGLFSLMPYTDCFYNSAHDSWEYVSLIFQINLGVFLLTNLIHNFPSIPSTPGSCTTYFSNDKLPARSSCLRLTKRTFPTMKLYLVQSLRFFNTKSRLYYVALK